MHVISLELHAWWAADDNTRNNIWEFRKTKRMDSTEWSFVRSRPQKLSYDLWNTRHSNHDNSVFRRTSIGTYAYPIVVVWCECPEMWNECRLKRKLLRSKPITKCFLPFVNNNKNPTLSKFSHKKSVCARDVTFTCDMLCSFKMTAGKMRAEFKVVKKCPV